MSDPQTRVGEPVEEPVPAVEDVVGSAQAGLAAAEAAGAEAAGAEAAGAEAVGATNVASERRLPDIVTDEPLTPSPVDDAGGRSGETVAAPADAAQPAPESGAEPAPQREAAADAAGDDTDEESDAVFATPALNAAYQAERAGATPDADGSPTTVDAVAPAASTADAAVEADASDTAPAAAAASTAEPAAAAASAPALALATEASAPAADSAADTVVQPAAEPVESAGAHEAVDTAFATQQVQAPASVAQPQPIFVQAPEEPRPRGNRAAAGGIGLVAGVAFAALYLASSLAVALVAGTTTLNAAGPWILAQLTTWGLWVPTVVFFVAFWLLGAIVNRGRWGAWVLVGLLVGVAAWAGHLLGQLVEAPFWMISAADGARLVRDQMFAPLAIAAFVIGRELTIWFSAWAAARGRKMTELNIEARREYERTLEAGPQGGR